MNFNETEGEKQTEASGKAGATGANPPNKKNQKIVRQILEENVDGLSSAELFFQLQTHDAVIPEWVQQKDQMKQYISSFIGALRKELEPEKKTVSKSPYRIIPTDDA